MHQLEKKHLRANHSSFMTLYLSKAIIKRSKFNNKFLKEKKVKSKGELTQSLHQPSKKNCRSIFCGLKCEVYD